MLKGILASTSITQYKIALWLMWAPAFRRGRVTEMKATKYLALLYFIAQEFKSVFLFLQDVTASYIFLHHFL